MVDAIEFMLNERSVSEHFPYKSTPTFYHTYQTHTYKSAHVY